MGRFVAVLLLLSLLLVTSHAFGDTEAQEFWSQFREAVLSEEVDKVAAMTHFPLWVRGTEDSDPVMFYGKKNFKNIWKRLLDQQIVPSDSDQVVFKAMRQVIKERKKIRSKDFQTPEIIRVELFRFDKIDGRWLLTQGYLEE